MNRSMKPVLCPCLYPEFCDYLAEYPHQSPYCLGCADEFWRRLMPTAEEVAEAQE
jgi:hypothetical protein